MAARRREHAEKGRAGLRLILQVGRHEGLRVAKKDVGQVVLGLGAVEGVDAVVGDRAVVVARVAVEAVPVVPALRDVLAAARVAVLGAAGGARQRVLVEVLAAVGGVVARLLELRARAARQSQQAGRAKRELCARARRRPAAPAPRPTWRPSSRARCRSGRCRSCAGTCPSCRRSGSGSRSACARRRCCAGSERRGQARSSSPWRERAARTRT